MTGNVKVIDKPESKPIPALPESLKFQMGKIILFPIDCKSSLGLLYRPS